MSSKKKFVLSLVVLASLVGAALIVYITMQPKTQENKPTGNTIIMQGMIACLPHKNSDQPHTLECATGLRTDANLYYGLKNLPLELSGTDKKIEVQGIIEQPPASNIYDTKGIINVTAARQL